MGQNHGARRWQSSRSAGLDRRHRIYVFGRHRYPPGPAFRTRHRLRVDLFHAYPREQRPDRNWGPGMLQSGVDPDHMTWLKEQVVASIAEACNQLRPARFVFGQDLSGRDSILIRDTRRPIVKATGIQVMQVLDAEADTTLGSVVNWSN